MSDITLNAPALFDLSGQVALVTGAGSGIGQRIALGFAQCGAAVACLDRRADGGLADTIELINQAGGKAIEGPFDGEESITLMADLDAGATGSMSSALLPDKIKVVVDRYLAGDRDAAMAQYNSILPLINFENRQCNLRATKTVMMEGGVIESDAVRHPFAPLPEATKAGLMELVREVDPVALTWGL